MKIPAHIQTKIDAQAKQVFIDWKHLANWASNWYSHGVEDGQSDKEIDKASLCINCVDSERENKRLAYENKSLRDLSVKLGKDPDKELVMIENTRLKAEAKSIARWGELGNQRPPNELMDMLNEAFGFQEFDVVELEEALDAHDRNSCQVDCCLLCYGEATSKDICLHEECSVSSKKYGFCLDHYEYFKFGLIRVDGTKPPDYTQKLKYYQDYKDRVGDKTEAKDGKG